MDRGVVSGDAKHGTGSLRQLGCSAGLILPFIAESAELRAIATQEV